MRIKTEIYMSKVSNMVSGTQKACNQKDWTAKYQYIYKYMWNETVIVKVAESQINMNIIITMLYKFLNLPIKTQKFKGIWD